MRRISIPKHNIKDPEVLNALDVIEHHVASAKEVEENTIRRPRQVRSRPPKHEEGRDGDLDLYIEGNDFYLAIKANGKWKRVKLEDL